MSTEYREFLTSKAVVAPPAGFAVAPNSAYQSAKGGIIAGNTTGPIGVSSTDRPLTEHPASPGGRLMSECITPPRFSPRWRDLTGQRFGRLTVVSFVAAERQGRRWSCRCDCGGVVEVSGSNLRTGNTQSCGCLHAERQRESARTHGAKGTKVYVCWLNMRQRCSNPRNTAYARYGGRGIRVCERWQSFVAFRADMGDPPDGMTLDRIDVNGDYEPGNCRWAGAQEQARNKRSNRTLTHDGKTQSLVAWAEETGIPYFTLHARLRRGWSASEALTTPVTEAAQNFDLPVGGEG